MLKIKTFYNNHIRTSVLANTIFLFALFIALAWLVFFLIPNRESRVSIDINELTSEDVTFVRAESVDMYFPNTFGLDLNDVRMDYSSIYADSTWAVVDDENEKDISDEELWLYEWSPDAYRSFSTLDPEKQLGARIYIASSVGDKHIEYQIEQLISGDRIITVMLPVKAYVYYECDVPFQITTTDQCGLVYGDYRGHDYRHVDAFKFYNPTNTLQFIIEEETELKIRLCEDSVVGFQNVIAAETTGSGEIYLSNSPQNEIYNTHNQTISVNYSNPTKAQVTANNGKLSLTMEGSTKDIALSGQKMGLSFRTWWIENSYALPTMLLTVMAGAITLAVSSRKQKEH